VKKRRSSSSEQDKVNFGWKLISLKVDHDERVNLHFDNAEAGRRQA
jgi:hypothetical protein